MEKWKAGPAGIMVLQANGAAMDSPTHLIKCAFDILAMLVAPMLLSRAALLGSQMARAGFVTMLNGARN